MPRNVSNAARQAINASNTGACFLVLLKLTHPDLTEPFRIVNDHQSIVSDGETYLPYNFDFTPPVEEDGTIKNSSLTIDNIDRAIVTMIRSISSAPTVTAKIILSDSPDTIEAGPWEFQMTNIVYNLQSVTGELIFENYLNDLISVVTYNYANFPGLGQ